MKKLSKGLTVFTLLAVLFGFHNVDFKNTSEPNHVKVTDLEYH